MSWLKNRFSRAHWSRKESQIALRGPETQEQGSPTPVNQTIFQGFEWHTPGGHWTRLSAALQTYADLGITSIWLPPGCKANQPDGNGYDCYDLWDLGEFEQKGSRSTKWGSREELRDLMEKARSLGIGIIWDAVLNHKTAGDTTEECWAVEVDPEDRRIEVTKPRKIEPWIRYTFPGRGDKYSNMKWHWQHFNGTDWDQRAERHAIYKIIDPPDAKGRRPKKGGKDWAPDVDDENGNFDYLMFSNIDYTNREARQDVLNWGVWMVSPEVGVTGFRLDAFKHVSWHFAREWTAHVKASAPDTFIVGEYWTGELSKLTKWVDHVGHGAYTYDAPLLNAMSTLSLAADRAARRSSLTTTLSAPQPQHPVDLRHLFKSTLVAARPRAAITMVTSHDTQAGQTMDTPIAPFFKPLAYALTLLRAAGLPCVFYGDLHGTRGPHAAPPACSGKLPLLLLARRYYAYGAQTDYFDARTSVGWVRHGTWDRPDGCAVVLSVAGPARKGMCVGRWAAGQTWVDVYGGVEEKVVLDERGCGVFGCRARSVSVWVREGSVPGDVWERAERGEGFKL
ncbi:glycoside hydrolase superfamily [Macrophomina phaseolina]|uniref:Glycoside hydrolase superfamily n=1 Tax=Macrophomina phaseolina TaxID=35725 RepID=A0ABQ8GGX0_9PEZI|nr:glycoside hydrolase superfamily [Macrophomina phaseolina]